MKLKYSSPKGIALDVLFGLICLYILIFRTTEVWGNLEASFIWAYPVFARAELHRRVNKEKTKNGSTSD